MLNYDSRLMFVSGFGAITFFLACIVLIFLPLSIPKWFDTSEGLSDPPFILNIILLVLIVTSFAFYIRYVGNVSITLYIMFKVVLVCMLPLIILLILYRNMSLERTILVLKKQNKSYFLKLEENEIIEEEEEIEILSDNKSDRLQLLHHNIIAVKSADNYIQIYYLENEILEKKLLRNTLINIELQFADHKSFIRCHRTSIINELYIDKLIRNYSGYHLQMSYLEELVPVSRQYLVIVKEILAGKK